MVEETAFVDRDHCQARVKANQLEKEHHAGNTSGLHLPSAGPVSEHALGPRIVDMSCPRL